MSRALQLPLLLDAITRGRHTGRPPARRAENEYKIRLDLYKTNSE
jgi:hypothetical protein